MRYRVRDPYRVSVSLLVVELTLNRKPSVPPVLNRLRNGVGLVSARRRKSDPGHLGSMLECPEFV